MTEVHCLTFFMWHKWKIVFVGLLWQINEVACAKEDNPRESGSPLPRMFLSTPVTCFCLHSLEILLLELWLSSVKHDFCIITGIKQCWEDEFRFQMCHDKSFALWEILKVYVFYSLTSLKEKQGFILAKHLLMEDIFELC